MASGSPETSEQLIARCAGGDAEALRALYEQTSAQLFGLLRRILGRDDLAQEALQDLYVSVWHHADRYSARKGAAFTWLVSIARYRAIDIKRSRKREVRLGDLAEGLADEADSELEADPLRSAAHDAEVKRLDDCLKQLELSQRSAVGMAYLRGLTHSEVAARLGAPIGTTKSWIRRGLQSLKGCLDS